ncbi:MAG: transposase [Spirosoma sp.]|nr:transposase [Spirosoma sp.]
MRNGFVENFNGRMRDALLTERLFFLLKDCKCATRVKAKLWEDRKPASRPNETWAMDFVCAAAIGREDVVAVLNRVCADVCYPKTIRVDEGSEFVSRDLDRWAYARGVTLGFSRRSKPTYNASEPSMDGSAPNA